MVFDLLNDVLDTMVKERWGNDLLAMAVRENCMPVIQRLMERSGQRASRHTWQHDQPRKCPLWPGQVRGGRADASADTRSKEEGVRWRISSPIDSVKVCLSLNQLDLLVGKGLPGEEL